MCGAGGNICQSSVTKGLCLEQKTLATSYKQLSQFKKIIKDLKRLFFFTNKIEIANAHLKNNHQRNANQILITQILTRSHSGERLWLKEKEKKARYI